MYPASFEYHRATSVDDAIAMMDKYGEDAKVLAGGHSLLPVMKLRFATPAHLIDIGRISSLSGVSESGGNVVIGATTRHSDVAASSAVQKSIPALSDAASMIGDVQIRNRGTIGGSVAHSDPGADMPAVLIALGAKIVAKGKGGERSIDAEECFTGTFATSLKAGELVTQVNIPVPGAGSGSAYMKFPDAASGYAVVGVAAQVTVAGGNVTAARVAITGLAEKATRLTGVESALVGKAAAAATADAAAQSAAQGLELFDDARGSAAYKANLAQVYTARAIKAALERAGA